MPSPDVTVVIPVYNTMPYLTLCLNSLVEQSIGRDRMEIIAVDDGSTDGGGAELDRFEQNYPGLVKVIHQANSGSPAGPCNRGLEVATGRFVFFIGADDYLGPDALRRMVEAGDKYDSDVVLGKVVGVNSRYVKQEIFASNQSDVDLFDSPLPYSLANTKLFRRDLLERHNIRYLEEMTLGSDLPFTLEACVRANRISVLGDYEFYYAVRRLDVQNITYLSRHDDRLRCAQQLVTFLIRLLPPGKQRDTIMLRYCNEELTRLLEDDFLRIDRGMQERVHAGIRDIVSQHLTDDIRARLSAETMVRLLVTQHGTVDELIAVIRQDAEQGIPQTISEGDRRYAAYPGFRTGLPDTCFDVTDNIAAWTAKLDVVSMSWRKGVLEITAHSPQSQVDAVICAEHVIGTTVESTSDVKGTTIRAQLNLGQMLADIGDRGGRRTLHAQSGDGIAALRAPHLPKTRLMIGRRGVRLFVVVPSKDNSGRLMVSATPVTPRRVIARLRSRLSK